MRPGATAVLGCRFGGLAWPRHLSRLRITPLPLLRSNQCTVPWRLHDVTSRMRERARSDCLGALGSNPLGHPARNSNSPCLILVLLLRYGNRKGVSDDPCGTAIELGTELIRFVTVESSKVRIYERLPGTTDVLESSFGKLKASEDGQSKSGFTGLVLSLGAIVRNGRTKPSARHWSSVAFETSGTGAE
jgi:hypothetical protein